MKFLLLLLLLHLLLLLLLNFLLFFYVVAGHYSLRPHRFCPIISWMQNRLGSIHTHTHEPARSDFGDQIPSPWSAHHMRRGDQSCGPLPPAACALQLKQNCLPPSCFVRKLLSNITPKCSATSRTTSRTFAAPLDDRLGCGPRPARATLH